MPRQGQSVESCIILEWKKQEGDAVVAGEILCEVETDKATFEVESPADGVLLQRLYAEGDEVPVLERIAYVGAEGETVATGREPDGDRGESGEKSLPPVEPTGVADSTAAGGEATSGAGAGAQAARQADAETRPEATAAAATPDSETREPQAGGPEDRGRVFISPRARERAERAGVPVELLIGSGPGGRIIERDVDAALAAGRVATRSAADGAAARSGRPEIEAAAGSGIGGRVTTADHPVAAGAGEADRASGAERAAAEGVAGRETSEQRLTGVRKRIAERMLESVQGSAQLTLHASADARALLAYRSKLKAAGERYASITINDLVLFAVARVLPHHRGLNGTLEGETLRSFGAVHLGMAVDTPRGLMVPVIRDADLLSPASISGEARRLAAACRDGGITPDELSGGTFSVTNLGSLGIEVFTPVLNPPQVAILGVCSVEPKPVYAADGEVEHIASMGLSLTIDHRVVDGAPAARFLQALGKALGSFEVLLSGAGPGEE